LGTVQPAGAFLGPWLRNVESLPCTLIHLVLRVDVPAWRKADELLIEELDRLIGIECGTTCQVVRRSTSANAQRFVVACAAGIEDHQRLIFGSRSLASGHHIGQPLDLKMPPLGLLRADK